MASQQAHSVLNKIGKEFLTCSICLDYYTNAKTLPCLHSYCDKCLQKLVEKHEELICPQCRATFVSDEVQLVTLGTNSFINGLVEFVKAKDTDTGTGKLSCEACEDSHCTNRCLDCAINLCQACSKAHRKIKVTRGHRLISTDCYFKPDPPAPDEQGDNSDDNNCKESGHEENHAKFYCTVCKTSPLCYSCVEHDHLGHKYVYLEDVVVECTSTLKEPLEILKEKQEESKKSADIVAQELISIPELFEVEVKRVKEHAAKVVEWVSECEKKLIYDLTKEKDTIIKNLECELDHYEITEKNISSTCSFIDVLMKYGDASDIICEYKKTMSRVEQLSNTVTAHTPVETFLKFQPGERIFKSSIGINTRVETINTMGVPTFVVVGEDFKVRIQTKDGGGNPIVQLGTVAVTAKLERQNGTLEKLIVIADGEHTVQVPGQKEGKHNLFISVGEYQVKGSPFTIEVVPEERTCQKTFQFTVQNISTLDHTGRYSPECLIWGIPWRILAQKTTDDHLGVYIECNARSTALSWSCKAKVVLELKNSLRAYNNYYNSFEHLFSEKMKLQGSKKFIPWSVLLEPSNFYYKEDTIVLEARVTANVPRDIHTDY